MHHFKFPEIFISIERMQTTCIHFLETESCNNLQPMADTMLTDILEERFPQKPVDHNSVHKDDILRKYYRAKVEAPKLP